MNRLMKNRSLSGIVSVAFLVISLVCGTNPSAYAQQRGRTRVITGRVTDSSGEPLAGVVLAYDADSGKTGEITDSDGKFRLQAPAAAITVEISYLGFATQNIRIPEGQQYLEVTMVSDEEWIDESVVVAFGRQKKETVTGAISMVQTKDLIQTPQANVSNMLTGRLPGLLAVQRSGEPGEDFSTLRIRGVGTFATGEGSQEPLVMVDGIETNNFNNIDPNEIESLSILKDASATAVYGVRGANGVILITTKRGSDGKPKISYSGNVAMTQFTDLRETMNAYEYATSYNQAVLLDTYITQSAYTPRFTDEEVIKYRDHTDPVLYPDMNWYDLMLQKHSYTTQHNINVSGGVNKVKYFISVGYYNQQGLFNQTSLLEGYDLQSVYERYNFRSNLDVNVTKRLSLKINIASQMENRSGNATPDGTTRLMELIGRANSVCTPGIIDGKIVYSPLSSSNPMVAFYQNGNKYRYNNNLTGAISMDYQIPGVPGLSLAAKISYENAYVHQRVYNKSAVMTYQIAQKENGDYIYVPLNTDSQFSASQSFDKDRRTYLEVGLNYARKFANAHNVSALLLYNQSRRVNPHLALKVPNSYQGLVGRVTYDFKNRYLFEVDLGYNGTENFAPGKRFGFFPAYSLGWVLTEEPFWRKNDVLNFFKIRGSYGEVGNDRIGGERFLYMEDTYVNEGGVYYFGGVNTGYNSYGVVGEGKIGNPELTWERAKKINAGLELTMWQSRIRFTGDWFLENRDNILANRNTTPVLFGGNAPAANLGKMRNTGFDAELSFTDTVGDFSYWVKGNYTYAHNTILDMDEIPSPYVYTQRTGQILDQYFGLICDGMYNTWEELADPSRPKSSWNNDRLQPGDLKYRDINGDGIIDDYDRVPIGYSNFPEIVFGASFGFNWKGVDFSVLFQGATHVSIQYSRLFTRGFSEEYSAPRYLLESWSQDRYEQGLPTPFPRLSVGNDVNKHNYQASTFWTRDASYLRLKNAEIGYTLPAHLIRRFGMSQLRVFLSGNNIYTWTRMFKGVDPEAAQQRDNYDCYPVTSMYNIGATVTF